MSNFLFVADNVRSLYNVGSMMRTLDCLGQSKIVVCGISGTTENEKLAKTALSAMNSVDVKYYHHCANALRRLRAEGYTIYIVEQTDGASLLADCKLRFPCAFVFGHEREGVASKLLRYADGCIALPNLGLSKSWNVSSTAAIVGYVAHQQLKKG